MARTTIKDVSERAGVSIGTVSNVLNAPQLVSPETRERVLAVVDELGYRPNRVARGLQAQRSYLIGYRLPRQDHPAAVALDTFLHELVRTAAGHELDVVLFTPRPGQDEVEAHRDLITRGDVDGFVLSETNYLDPRIEVLTGSGFPFVAFGRSRSDHRFAWVDIDGRAGTVEATGHLLSAGHRRIALVAWPEGSESGDDRAAGYFDALATSGIPADPRLVVRVPNGIEHGRAAWRRLASLADPPSAVVTVQDLLGLGVMLEAGDDGLRPGADVAVTGFDDSPVASLMGLTSLRQPMGEVCRLLLEHLSSRIERPEAAAGNDLVPPELVVRGSSGGGATADLPAPVAASGRRDTAPLSPSGAAMSSWQLVEDSFVPGLLPWKESLFTVANGYLGTRGSFEEGIAGETRATFINGLFVTPPGEVPLLGAVPDWTRVLIDGGRGAARPRSPPARRLSADPRPSHRAVGAVRPLEGRRWRRRQVSIPAAGVDGSSPHHRPGSPSRGADRTRRARHRDRARRLGPRPRPSRLEAGRVGAHREGRAAARRSQHRRCAPSQCMVCGGDRGRSRLCGRRRASPLQDQADPAPEATVSG